MDAFMCPISYNEMSNPVIAMDGHTYERSSIERWFAESDRLPAEGVISPMTGEVIGRMLLPNYTLKKAIDECAEQQGNKDTPLPTAETFVPQISMVMDPCSRHAASRSNTVCYHAAAARLSLPEAEENTCRTNATQINRIRIMTNDINQDTINTIINNYNNNNYDKDIILQFLKNTYLNAPTTAL